MKIYYVWHETEEPNGVYEYFNDEKVAKDIYDNWYGNRSKSFGIADFIDNKLEPTEVIDFCDL